MSSFHLFPTDFLLFFSLPGWFALFRKDAHDQQKNTVRNKVDRHQTNSERRSRYQHLPKKRKPASLHLDFSHRAFSQFRVYFADNFSPVGKKFGRPNRARAF